LASNETVNAIVATEKMTSDKVNLIAASADTISSEGIAKVFANFKINNSKLTAEEIGPAGKATVALLTAPSASLTAAAQLLDTLEELAISVLEGDDK
jgi:hypothetical protein